MTRPSIRIRFASVLLAVGALAAIPVEARDATECQRLANIKSAADSFRGALGNTIARASSPATVRRAGESQGVSLTARQAETMGVFVAGAVSTLRSNFDRGLASTINRARTQAGCR